MAEQNVMKDVTEQRLRDLEVSLHGFEREGTKTSDEILQKHHIRSGILNDINKLTQEQNKIRELITQIQSTLAAGLNKQAVYDALDYLKAEDMRLQESIEKLYFQLGQVDKRVQTALVDVDDMHSGFRDRLNNKLIYLGSLSFAIPFCSFVVAFAGYGLYKLYKNCDLPKRSKIVRSALTITAMVAISLGVSYGVHNGMQIYFGS